MSTPRISVVLPVHNAGDYLPIALASLRWQTFTDWEAVCVDDGSTDGSHAVLERFAQADRRFRVVRQPARGLVAALNHGLDHAGGEWIARMDGDDVALPERFTRQLAFANDRPDCVGFGAAVRLIDPDGDPIGSVAYPEEHRAIENNLLTARGGTIAHPTLFARRAAIEAAGPYRHEFETVQDTDLLLRLAQVGPLANLPDELLLYRQHPKNYCRVHHATIQDDMLRLLESAHRERGTRPDDAVLDRLRRPPRQTPLVGKWARKAARSGHLQTAAKLTRRLLRDAPLSPYSARVLAEVVVRGALSLAAGRHAAAQVTSDWREWDAGPSGGQTLHAA